MEKNQQKSLLPQTSKSVFLVSSALHAKHGVYSLTERIDQSIKTFESIQNYANGSDIIVLDGGYKNISQEDQDALKKYINAFYSFSDTDQVKVIQESTNWDIVKNMIELIMFGSFFAENQSKLMEKYDRIFKLSGRYTLNENFDYERHMKAKDKILIRGPYTSQFTSEITGGVNTQYMSRLWSFDSALLSQVSESYAAMFVHMLNRLRENGYIDIEHLLQHHLPADKVELLSQIGVQGNIAPNGVAVVD